jgi:NTP pyrophosphatase (non-canonical NTP hydrolase)
MRVSEFQKQIEALYGERDRRRGADATFRRLVEEVGELARALRSRDRRSLGEEISDVLAWTVSVATLVGVDAEAASLRYAAGCPKCGQTPCVCPEPAR